MRVFIRSGPKNGVTGKVTVGPPPLGTVPGLGPTNAPGSGDPPYRGVGASDGVRPHSWRQQPIPPGVSTGPGNTDMGNHSREVAVAGEWER